MSDDSGGPGLYLDLDRPSRVTVVAFGGLVSEGQVIPFEFFRFLSGLDVRRVFLRDHEQAWYQLGVRDVADSLDGVGAYLLEELGADGLRHAVFTGGSMGAYAAMLLGSRLGVAEVQAFAPQTFISRVLRRYYKDFRWQKQINATWARSDKRSSYQDIKPALRRLGRTRATPLHVHVGTHRVDLHHVQRIRRVPGVKIHRYAEITDHNVAGALNATGQLRSIFDAAIARASAVS